MNADNLILSIGVEGSFELSPPFTNNIQAKAKYTIRSIRTMGDIIAAGDNPQELYTTNQVPEAEYIRDLQADVCIIGLQSTSGDWVYVPQSYIVTLPNIEGVSYRPLAVVVALGMVSDETELINVTTAIERIVFEQLGVKTTTVITAVGASELVSAADDARIKVTRSERINYNESEAAHFTRLNKENAELRSKLQMLNDYIKRTL